MMGTTHAAMGLTLALGVAAGRPEWALPVALAGIVGGLLPDLDILVGEHRRTLHYPVYTWPAALAALAAASAAPGVVTASLAVLLAAAALHATTDALGGQTGGRPWEYDGDRGVYSHHTGAWVAPRRWIRYDGAPEDLALCYVLAVPALVLFDGPIRTLATFGVVVSVAYVLVRKRLPSQGDPHAP